MNLAELQERVRAIAEADGWWDEEPPFGDVIASAHYALSVAYDTLASDIESWRVDTGFLLANVVLRAADVAERFGFDLAEGVREAESRYEFADDRPEVVAQRGMGTWISTIHMHLSLAFEVYANDHVEWPSDARRYGVEIGAAVRWMQLMAAHYEIDLEAAIRAKLDYGRVRPPRPGGVAL